MRYRIMGRPYGQNGETEICQVDSNPLDIVAAAREKRLKGERGSRELISKYEHVYALDKETGEVLL